MLPNFIIAGPPKSGTTSLQLYLDRHPDIFARGETHFFCDNYGKGIEWYRQQFAAAGAETAVGEKTPHYFFHPHVPERIHQWLPDVKLVFIFRDPVERTYSHYWHNVRKANEERSFEAAVEEELADDIGEGTGYVGVSTYVFHLRRWLEYFSLSDMFFLTLEGLDQQRLHDICRFLEVDTCFEFGELRSYNIGGAPKSQLLTSISQHPIVKKIPYLSDFINRVVNMRRGKYPPMNTHTRMRLENYFKPYNQELEECVDIDLSSWGAKEGR